MLFFFLLNIISYRSFCSLHSNLLALHGYLSYLVAFTKKKRLHLKLFYTGVIISLGYISGIVIFELRIIYICNFYSLPVFYTPSTEDVFKFLEFCSLISEKCYLWPVYFNFPHMSEPEHTFFK